ncbi:Uncharacterized protein dnm_068100 [Desulfonema magnum]|uniref:Tyrosine kinase G-rich domain-containing protein n=1 Tax=Desulfonema magnum TaxID=45655 RepID=A0A975GR94_9BACT|nr:Uncharacterized protein dnm_068100 [Desulfonema magnum]
MLITVPEVDEAAFGPDMKVDVTPGVVKTNLILDEIYILQSHGLHKNIAQNIKDKDALISGYWQTVLPGFFTYISETKEKIKQQLVSFLKKGEAAEPVAENTLETFASCISEMCVTETLRDSDIIEIRCRHHHQDLIKAVLDAYLSEYHKLRNTIWFDKDAPNFFQKHSANYFKQWQEHLDELMKLKETPDIIDPVQEKAKLEDQQMGYLSEILSLKTRVKELKNQAKIFSDLTPEEAVIFTTEGIEKDPLLKELKMRIGVAMADRSELLGNFQPGASSVVKLNYQIADLYAEYKKLTANFFEKETEKNRIRMRAFSSAVKKTEDRICELNQRLFQMDKHRYQIKMLEEKLERYEKQYADYETKAMKITLQEELRKTVTTIKVVSPPFVSEKPVWPKKTMLVILAIMLSFFFTLLFIVIMQMMDDSFHLPREVTRELNLPVLASFPVKPWQKIIRNPADKPGFFKKLGSKKKVRI